MFLGGMITAPVLTQGLIGPMGEEQSHNSAPAQLMEHSELERRDWPYGGFIDLGDSINFNFPENHLFRNRSTTPRVNELDLNMAGVYMRKEASAQFPWGTELLVQGGARRQGLWIRRQCTQG